MSQSFCYFCHNIHPTFGAFAAVCPVLYTTTTNMDENDVQKADDLGGYFAHNGNGTILYTHNYTTPTGSGAFQKFERSTDYGRTWTTISTLARATDQHLSKLEYHAASNTWIVVQWDNNDKLNNMRYSQDNGDTWTGFGNNTGCGFSYSTGFFIRDDKLYHMGAGLSNTHWIESWDMPPGQTLPDVSFQTAIASNFAFHTRATVVFANNMFVINGQEGLNGLFKIDKTNFGSIQKWNTVDDATLNLPISSIPWFNTTRRQPFKAINANYAYYPARIDTTGTFPDTAVFYKFEDTSAPTVSAWPTIECDWSDTLSSEIKCVDLARNPNNDKLYMIVCETQGIAGGQPFYVKESEDEGATWTTSSHVINSVSGARNSNVGRASTFQLMYLRGNEFMLSYVDYTTISNTTMIIGFPDTPNSNPEECILS